MLEYDNSAFYYFSVTLVTIYLLPVASLTLKQILDAVRPPKDRKLEARTSVERQKIANLRKENHGLERLAKSWGFWLQVASLVVAAYVLCSLLMSSWGDAEIARFDPYAILGIDVGTGDKGIKKAYRQLSLQYHPDKNPNNKMAEDMFMKIAKAYEALTDPQAKENWEKYGNPDGKQPMEVSIALPTFLLDKEYHNAILITYLIAMVVVIPVIVAMWYSHSKKYGEKNVMYDSYAWYNHMINKNARLKAMPEVLAGSAEFRAIINSKEMLKINFKPLMEQLQEETNMPKPKYNHATIVKGTMLLYAHVLRQPIPPECKKSLNAMLIKAPELMEAVIEVACSRRWLAAVQAIIEFSQCLTQALWTGDSDLAQLPHFTKDDIKALALGKGPITSIAQYIKVPDEEKRGLGKLTEEERRDVLNVCQVIPDVEVQVSAFVEDEEQIAENDLVTIRVTLTRKNVPEGQQCPPVHAPRFPVPREESWWVLVGNSRQDQIYGFERITDQGRVVEKDVKIMGPDRAGNVQLEVFVMCDAYRGLDQELMVKFQVVPSSTLPEYKPHPDDLELDNEPTLFEQVMTGYDDDTDSDEEGDGAAANKKAVGHTCGGGHDHSHDHGHSHSHSSIGGAIADEGGDSDSSDE